MYPKDRTLKLQIVNLSVRFIFVSERELTSRDLQKLTTSLLHLVTKYVWIPGYCCTICESLRQAIFILTFEKRSRIFLVFSSQQLFILRLI